MFQNIAKELDENEYEEEKQTNKEKGKIKQTLKKCFSEKACIIYLLSFMLSLVSIGKNTELAPFGLAIIVAVLSSCNPIGIIALLVFIGSFISFGGNHTLNIIFTVLLVVASMLIKAPKYQEEINEKRKLGTRLFISTLIVQIVGLIFSQFYIYNLIFSLVYSICVYIFYKIFVNAIPVLKNLGEKRAYTIEEVMGASLLVAIAFSCIGGFTIFGYSVRNILCIFIVLLMGWKNGILVGTTAGVTIGSVIGIISGGEPIMVATYALSGMLAGIFNKLGKIGVIIGFILGNVLLTYITNGNTVSIIAWQEILIASLGLLAVPKTIKIPIEDLYGKTKLLPETTSRTLEESKEAIVKLNNMSETLFEMAKTYKEAAVTIVDEEELKKQEAENFKIFDKDLQNNLEGMEENILFDDIYSPEDDLLEDIFNEILEKEKIERDDFLKILAKHNNYIVDFEENYSNNVVEEDIKQILKAINDSYKVSKLNFIWKKKLEENKKAVSSQLEEVSKAIGTLAEDMEDTKEEFLAEKEQIKEQLEENEIYISDITIKKQKTDRLETTIYTNICQNVENPACNIKKMGKIISKILEKEMILQKQECGLRTNTNICKYSYIEKDKQKISIGVAKATKADYSISGDSSIQTKLEDGKYLLAISDGKGSGKEAKRASKTAITMLDKLLSSGFNKDSSLKVINSTLSATMDEEMYATLDIAILDLYAKNLEFIKNGACPTFVKNKRNVQILKSLSLPTGIINNIDLVVYDKDIEDEDIIVMCTDGVLESSKEFTNKELWLKFLLEEIETTDEQKIADIILQEAIDNNYGTPKDDMTVIVAKIKNIKD